MISSFSIRYLFLIGFIFVFTFNTYAQKLHRVLGEYIVQVDSDRDFEAGLKSIYSSDRRYSDLRTRQIMSSPLNIWVISIDYTKLNEFEFERNLQKVARFKEVRRNRLIEPRLIPNDAEFSKQWQYINTGANGGLIGADMDMDLAWDISTGGITSKGDTIVVCVIDDGINANHEDMKDNIWTNRNEISGNGIDDDGNGYIDDVFGWNVILNTDEVNGGGSHGTPVAGIIGAKGNNSIGLSGVNWNVKLMIVNYGSSSEANAIAAYAYPYQMRKLYNATGGTKGAFVVATNASWGIDQALADSAPLWCALYDSLGQVGILNCGATTNSNTNVDVLGDLPTSCGSEHLISVTNLNRSDVKLTNAGYGRKAIDLGSYGHQAYTVTRTAYGAFGGTSGATPHVTGAIGLIYSAHCPKLMDIAKLNPSKASLIVKDMILHGVSPISSLLDVTTSGGKLNVHRALSNIEKLCEPCSVPAGIVLENYDTSIKVTWATNSGTSALKCRYRKFDENSWKEITGLTNGAFINQLDFCTEYEIQISSDCGYIGGDYSYSKFINTMGCCTKPSNFVGVGLDSTIQVSWKNELLTDYKLSYKSGAGSWVDINVDTNFYTLKNVAPCTGYAFRIQAMCNKYNNTSDYTEEIIVSTPCGSCSSNDYCDFGTKDASQEWIETFKLGNIFNISGSASSGYRDFAGLFSTDMIKGQEYNFEIIPRYAGGTFSDYFNIFIDFNQDGNWSDDENVYKTLTSVQNTVTGKFRVPDSTMSGVTRLRLIMAYENFEGGCDKENFEYGEVEDYCINLVPNTCNNNIKVTTYDIEKTIVNLKALPISGTVDSLLFAIREKGMIVWSEIKTSDSIKIVGLKECTVYEYQYRSRCGDIYSNVSQIDTFKTACINSTLEIKETYFKVYPNPFSDQLNITSNESSETISEVRIINSSGREVIRKSKLRSESLSLDLSQYLPGIYLLELTNKSGKKQFKKVVKM